MDHQPPTTNLGFAGLNPGRSRGALGWLLVHKDTITRCNRVFESLFGFGPDELIGAPFSRIFPSIAQFEAFTALAEGRSGDAHAQIEVHWRFARSDASEMRCRFIAQAWDQKVASDTTLWLVEDVGEAIAQTAALHKSIEQSEAMVQNAPVGIIVTVNRHVVRANPEFCRMFRYAPDAALNLVGRDLFPSDQIYADLGATVGPLLSAGKPAECEMQMVRGNGDVFWAHLVAYVVNPHETSNGTIWMVTDRSDFKRSEEAQAKAMLENQIILDSAAVGIVYLKNRIIQRCNPKAEQIFGFEPGAMLGISTRAWYQTEADYQRVAQEFYPALVAGTTFTQELTLVRTDGTPIWCRLSGQVLDPDAPIAGHSIWVVEDLSLRHANEQALASAKALMQGVFDSAKVSIIVTDAQGIIRMMNQTAASWLQYDPKELIGQASPRVFHDLDEVVAYSRTLSEELGSEVPPGFDTFVIKARLKGSDEHEWTYIRRDGSRFPVHLTTSTLLDAQSNITGYIGVGVDMTDRNRADNAMRVAQMQLEERVALRTAELASTNLQLQEEIARRKATEEKMRQMAHYDGLTGLPNRNLLMGRLEKAIAQADRRGSKTGLMFIDLDRFKQVNDTLGHDAGDELLRQVARRMGEVIRDTDTLARHGGDEFVLLVPDVAQQQELADLATRLVRVFASAFDISGNPVVTTPSIGISCYPTDCASSDELMRCADHAMYQAKTAGKNRFHFFSTFGA